MLILITANAFTLLTLQSQSKPAIVCIMHYLSLSESFLLSVYYENIVHYYRPFAAFLVVGSVKSNQLAPIWVIKG